MGDVTFLARRITPGRMGERVILPALTLRGCEGCEAAYTQARGVHPGQEGGRGGGCVPAWTEKVTT
jgi:hypothetical protein